MKWTSKIPWTDEQLSAITAESGRGDIIVSAAAGSGKTTVLVERIIKNVIERKTRMDRLLVVTFTEAAAAEMRERIIDSLKAKREEIKGTPGAPYEDINYLDEQVFLSETADIMTIDAFCNRVVSNNYHALGIDPAIRIADHATLEMLRDEAIEKLFNEMYVELYENDPNNRERTDRFERLVECYGTDRNDNALGKLLKDVHGFAVSFKDVDAWLSKSAELYAGDEYEKQRLNSVKTKIKRCRDTFDEYKKKFDEYSEIAEDKKNYSKITSTAEKLSVVLNAAVNASSFDELESLNKEYFERKSWSKFVTVALKLTDQDFLERYGEMAKASDDIKETIKKLCGKKQYGKRNNEYARQQVSDIVFIVREYIKKYDEEKKKLNVFEFSDIEHKAYELFSGSKEVRDSYKNKYDEILIDEYQDTNELQDSLFEIISKKNRFMVGDLKQSIYRFRGGDPYIFKEKSDRFESDDNDDIKIVLSQNFRSRQEILRGVNDIFSLVMNEDVGDVDYKKEKLRRLTANKDYDEPELCSEIKPEYKPEMHYLYYAKSDQNELDKKDHQVIFIADKIRELLDSGEEVYDKKLKRKRPLMKKDIVILERSVRDNGQDLVSALAERGIEAYVKTTSYFKCREIVVMMSVINIINNALQDIPFIAVMRSPIWGFTDEELVRIKYEYPRPNMVMSMRACAEDEGGELGAKCKRASEQLKRWRQYVRKMSVAQLIWSIYEETGFFDIIGAIDEGEEAQFNLKVLYEKAYEYEKTGFKGLANFIRYIEREESNEENMESVSLVGEEQDVVRIMTFHKSKGLEFPYVFVVNLGKIFYRGVDSAAIMHKDQGIAIKSVDMSARVKSSNDGYDVISERNRAEDISEQLRVLYVALTRAKERLFAVASVEHKTEMSEDEIMIMLREKAKRFSDDNLAAADVKGFSDWVCPAASISTETWKFELHNMAEYCSPVYDENAEKAEEKSEQEIDENEVRRVIDELMGYRYKYTELSEIPSRVSVTQLKERELSRESEEAIAENEPESRGGEDISYMRMQSKPKFMRKGELSPNEKGTIYHLIMSKLDYDKIRGRGADAIDEECSRLVEEGTVRESDMKIVRRENDISAFFESDIGKRALNSPKLYREKPFQMAIPLSEYDTETENAFNENGEKKYSGETIILQGIIDMFFEENGGIVIVDYKTDNVSSSSPQEIRARYKKQLELYSEAVSKLTGKPVTESVLYLAKTGETV